MSTYNGEKYIREQLDSIIAQVGDMHAVIYVRDDGSTDATVSILEEYASAHEEIEIRIDRASNVGASKSFLTATRECPDADIYAYSDQDDIWMQGKLGAAVSAIKDADSGYPIILSSTMN